MTLPEATPALPKESQRHGPVGQEAVSGSGSEGEEPALLRPASDDDSASQASQSGSRRASAKRPSDSAMAHSLGDALNDSLGDILKRETLGDTMLSDEEADRYGAASSASRRSSAEWLPPTGSPMREIMDGATVATLPRYIFKAHEMTQSVRNILQVRTRPGRPEKQLLGLEERKAGIKACRLKVARGACRVPAGCPAPRLGRRLGWAARGTAGHARQARQARHGGHPDSLLVNHAAGHFHYIDRVSKGEPMRLPTASRGEQRRAVPSFRRAPTPRGKSCLFV